MLMHKEIPVQHIYIQTANARFSQAKQMPVKMVDHVDGGYNNERK